MHTIVIKVFALAFISTVHPCREPDEGTLPSIQNDPYGETLQIIPESEAYASGERGIIPSAYIDLQRIYLKGDINCPFDPYDSQRLTRRRIQYKSQRSTCPWYYVKNVDENRKPRELIEAKCACGPDHQCGRDNSRGIVNQIENSENTSCKPVYFYPKVLRRTGCTNGEYSYRPVFEPIAVACTCVREPLPFVITNQGMSAKR